MSGEAQVGWGVCIFVNVLGFFNFNREGFTSKDVNFSQQKVAYSQKL